MASPPPERGPARGRRPVRVPEGGHARLAFRIGADVAVEMALVIYDDCVDLEIAGMPTPVMLGEHELLRFERLLRQARRMMPDVPGSTNTFAKE